MIKNLNPFCALSSGLRRLTLLAGFLLASSLAAQTQTNYWMTQITGIPGSTSISAAQINDLGQVVGSASVSSTTHAFLWLPAAAYGLSAGTHDIHPPSASYSHAYGINGQGQVVGYANFQSGGRAFLWLPAAAYGLPAGVNYLGTLSGGAVSGANAINRLGQVAGFSDTIGGYRAFIWLPAAAYGLPAGMNDLGTLPGSTYNSSEATGINDLGQIVGNTYRDSNSTDSFLWLPAAAYGLSAGINDLGFLPGQTFGGASGINNLGQVVGTSADNYLTGFNHAYLWLPSPAYNLPAGLNDLSPSPGVIDCALGAINSSGQAAGVNGSNSLTGFLWQDGVTTTLGTDLAAINNMGQTVNNVSGSASSSVLTPIGEPQPNHGGNSAKNLVTVTFVYRSANIVKSATLLAPGPYHTAGTNSDDIAGTALVHIDNYSLRATFNLSGHTPGPRTVVLTTTSGGTSRLPVPFTIDNSGGPQITVNLVGGITANVGGVSQQFLRVGHDTTYQLTVSNIGDVDAAGVPLWISFPNLPAGVSVNISDIGLTAPPNNIPGLSVNWNNTDYPAFVTYDPQGCAPFLVPRIPAGSTRVFQLRVNVPVSSAFTGILPIQAWATPLYHLLSASTIDPQVQTSLKALAENVYVNAAGTAPVDADFNSAAGQVVTQIGGLINGAYANASATGSPVPLSNLLEEILLQTPQGRALSLPVLKNAAAITLNNATGITGFSQESLQSVLPAVGGSIDPNGLGGSLGFTDAAGNTYVNGSQPLQFTVSFANNPNATLPAQSVALADTLDSNSLDLTALQLGTMNLEGTDGSQAFLLQAVSTGTTRSPFSDPSQNISQSYSKTVTVLVNGAPAMVDINASTNLNTGVLACSFASEVNGFGFLVPGAGGSMTFSVPWKAGVPAGTVLSHNATIKFDANAALTTNSVRYILDNAAPVSQIAALPATMSSPSIPVRWSGQDNTNGCGLKDYTISVSDNGGPFTVWLFQTTETSDVYSGQFGHTYTFQSAAEDNLGNMEIPVKTAVTMVLGSVSGTLNFEGISSMAPAQNVTFTFRPSDGTASFSRTLTVPANGSFTLTGLPLKQYTVHIKGDKYLAANLSVNLALGAVSGLTALLGAGDANNDNSVDTSDFNLLAGAFGSMHNPNIPDSMTGYDPRADFNGDSIIDTSDFNLLAGGFGSTGAP